MSKTASKVTRCGWRFTSVAAYAARTVSRSCQRTFSRALIASSPSASDTDRPAERNASTKPMWVSSRLIGSLRRQLELFDRTALVRGVLEDHAQRAGDGRLVEVGDLERDQRARPVDGLRDGRRLLELELAQPDHDVDELG